MRRHLLAPLLVLLTNLATAQPHPAADGLANKVFTGYQGWSRTPDDHTPHPWHHLGHLREGVARFAPGHAAIDLWPDVAELPPDARADTDFRHADGSVAQVFRATHPAVADRHLQWMADHDIAGLFLQRFPADRRHPANRAAMDQVLANVRAAAATHHRAWCVMYDLSGLRADELPHAVLDDWQRLAADEHVTGDPAYLRHHGRPVVAVWGVGFNDGRDYTLDQCAQLIAGLRALDPDDPPAIMLGVPFHWRTGTRDALPDPALRELIASADIVSPWAVGRLRTTDQASSDAHAAHLRADADWLADHGTLYLPVAFPGFSWHNLRHGNAPLNEIPRDGGRFLWAQAVAAHDAGAPAIYLAMFDELDEGTALFKIDPDPPVGDSPFLPLDDTPPDHYLRLAARIHALFAQD